MMRNHVFLSFYSLIIITNQILIYNYLCYEIYQLENSREPTDAMELPFSSIMKEGGFPGSLAHLLLF